MKIRALRDKILVEKIEKGERKTTAGIVLPDDDGKEQGVRARWGRVHAVGPDVHDVKVGQWVYIEHGRWTRAMDVKYADSEKPTMLWGTTEENILLVADEQPVEFASRY